MYNYIIKGGKKLEGEVEVSGSKNATLPILAATILSGKTTKLYNVPNIEDVKTTIKILEYMGCKIKKEKNKLIINSKNIKRKKIPEELMRKLRSSVVLVGAILARFGEARFSYPGGCEIGARPIDLHLSSFKKLGVKIEESAGFIGCKCDTIKSSELHLDFPSVGATENIILASVFASGEITVTNSAMEPEIVDLCNILNKMGAKIKGAGTNEIKITGVKNLTDVSYTIMPDRIEAGTLLVAAAITGGKIKLNKVIPEHITPIISKLEECGCKIKTEKRTIYLETPKRINATTIKTMPYPGFPTDMQPIFSVLLMTAKGTSVIQENIFENRFKYVQELKRMGAKAEIQNNTLIITGVRKLQGAKLEATDLRGGAAMILSGLAAKGKTQINKLEYVLRGYENLDKKLISLGANIIRKEGE
ncbi:MAG: UDP-N-acetylglucosamine 1-carboxyvinyltransferase [Candidatus Scatovivens sp.]